MFIFKFYIILYLIINICLIDFAELKKYGSIRNPNLSKYLKTQTTSELIDDLNSNPFDPNSFARPDQSIVTNILWAVTVNFETETIFGFVELMIEKKDPSIDRVILDSSNLTIYEVIDVNSGEILNYEMSEHIKSIGSKFTIILPQQNTTLVRITYETAPSASGLQWLKPEQTLGKQKPYLFSQCQAIHCRSILPIQDTPSVKNPYKAIILAPKDLTVLMSALHDGDSLTNNGQMKMYRFTQSVPIPSYLIAIAVGALESRKIGPRSSVWSEREIVDSAAYEFADTEMMLMAAESLLGQYVWGKYDLLVLPPSFPYGGMENPCLTFVTPTIIAGDRSMVSVIAHEIGHSWTGNLVTNANSEHFWLNEGFTVFNERKILGLLYGGEQRRQFEAIGGLKSLKYDVDSMGKCNPMTKLVTNLKGGINGDQSYTKVPYEKGSTFLFYLEQTLGGSKVFEPFLRSYIEKFKYKSIVTNDFKLYLYNYFNNQSDDLNKIKWNQWVHCPGMPPVIPEYDTTLNDVSRALSNKWVNVNDNHIQKYFLLSDIEDMIPQQISLFLAQLFEVEPPLSYKKVQSIVEIYNLNETKNNDIRLEWIKLGLRSHWYGCINDAIRMVSKYGRIAYLRPIFRELYSWEETRNLAFELYMTYKNQWMFVTTETIEKILHLDPS